MPGWIVEMTRGTWMSNGEAIEEALRLLDRGSAKVGLIPH